MQDYDKFLTKKNPLQIRAASIDLLAKRPLLITTGEPAGIGMDVVLMLADAGKLQDFDRPIWVTADHEAMSARADRLLKAGTIKNDRS